MVVDYIYTVIGIGKINNGAADVKVHAEPDSAVIQIELCPAQTVTALVVTVRANKTIMLFRFFIYVTVISAVMGINLSELKKLELGEVHQESLLSRFDRPCAH